MGRSVKAGNAHISVSVDGADKAFAGLQKKLGKLGKDLTTIGAPAALAGGAIVAGFGAAALHVADVGGAINDMSARTGIGAEALQELGHAAALSGSSVGTLEKGVLTLAKNVTAAAGGSEGAQAKLAALGLTFEDLKSLSPEDQFALVADRVASIEDPTARAAAATAVLGKSGAQLLPLMMGGAQGIAAARSEAQALGIVMSGESVAAADALGDTIDNLTAQFGAVSLQVGAAIAGPLNEFLMYVSSVLPVVIDWIAQNQTLIVVVGGVATAVAAAGAAAVAIGTVLSSVGVIVTAATATFTALVSVVGVITAGFGLLASPVIAVVAANAAVIEVGGRLLGFSSPLGSLFTALGEGAAWAAGKLSDVLGATIGWLIDKLQGFVEWLGLASGGVDDVTAKAGQVPPLPSAASPPPASLTSAAAAPAGVSPAEIAAIQKSVDAALVKVQSDLASSGPPQGMADLLKAENAAIEEAKAQTGILTEILAALAKGPRLLTAGA
jgi:hypothetical protein